MNNYVCETKEELWFENRKYYFIGIRKSPLYAVFGSNRFSIEGTILKLLDIVYLVRFENYKTILMNVSKISRNYFNGKDKANSHRFQLISVLVLVSIEMERLVFKTFETEKDAVEFSSSMKELL